MRNVEILINRHLVDYFETKDVPLSMRKQIDKFLERVGADGTQVDNVLKSLSLPPTKANQAFLLTLMAQSSLGRGSTRVAVQVIVNGVQLFGGPGILKSAKKTSHSTPSFLVELLGDGLTLWEKIDDVSLTDLDMGAMTYAFSDILSNWDDETVQAFAAYWCPVVYGTERHDGIFSIQDFRPSVRFAPIINAIFNGAGYTVHSEFMETQFFQRHAHTFGVGSKWRIAAEDWRLAYVVASFGPHNAYLAPPNPIANMVPLTPSQDPLGMYSNNGEPPTSPGINVNPDYQNKITVPYEGYYDIKFQINTPVPTRVDFQIVRAPDVWPTVTDVITFWVADPSPVGSPGQTLEVRQMLQAGDEVWMTYMQDNPAWLYQVRSVKLRISLSTKPYLGADISVSSCLPDKPAKSFLRGVSDMFDLVWRVDEITKRVFFEPRFDYTLIEGGVKVTRKGFYRRNLPLVQNILDVESVSVEYVTPFGKSLKLGYAPSSDPMEKATLTYLGRDVDKKQPPYCADIVLHDRGKPGQFSSNPYFTTLYQSQPSDMQLREDAYLPTMLPQSYNRGSKLPGFTWTPPGGTETTEAAPTYESEPKCGIIFPKALLFEWYYNDSDVTYFNEDTRAPWITQQKWADVGIAASLKDYDNAPCYADLIAKDTGRVIYGLVSTFYPNYISIIKEGQVLKGKVLISLPNFTAIAFQAMWALKYDGNDTPWILLELAAYKALVSDDSQGTFIKYVSPKQEDMDGVTYDDPNIDPLVPDSAPEL
jgi:hypothetical protein